MQAVLVGGRRDAAELPLPPEHRLPGPGGSGSAERAVMSAFMTVAGDLVVDEWCDPVALEIGGLSLEVRAATARQAKVDARLVSVYLWGAAELAHRSGAPSARERREWGAREMLTELACALRLPEGSLARRLARLTRLQALPRLSEAHRRGVVSSWHLDLVLDVFGGVTDPELLARADGFLAERAARMTAPELRACARGWRTRHVPRTDEQRRVNLAARRVEVTPADEDLCWLSALIPAAQAVAIDHRLDALAASARDGGDERSHAEVRADALVDLLLTPGDCASATGDAHHGVDEGDAPEGDVDRDVPRGVGSDTAVPAAPGRDVGRGVPGHVDVEGGRGGQSSSGVPVGSGGVPQWVCGTKPELVLTVPVLSLLGHSDEPAELEGFGPIDLDTARMLAANAPSFVRVLTHPETGTVLSVGRDRYRLPEDLKRAVRLRDRTCRFPGCRRRARGCDIDHSTAWEHGGATDICNLECLCRKHHRLKHQMAWTVTHEPNDTLRWRSPLGLTYWTHPGDTWPPPPAPPPAPPPRSPEPTNDGVPVAVLSGYPDEPPF